MKKIIGRNLLILGIVLKVGIFVILGGFGIYYIVNAFRNDHIIGGIIAIPITGIAIWLAFFLLSILSVPYTALVAKLNEDK